MHTWQIMILEKHGIQFMNFNKISLRSNIEDYTPNRCKHEPFFQFFVIHNIAPKFRNAYLADNDIRKAWYLVHEFQ